MVDYRFLMFKTKDIGQNIITLEGIINNETNELKKKHFEKLQNTLMEKAKKY